MERASVGIRVFFSCYFVCFVGNPARGDRHEHRFALGVLSRRGQDPVLMDVLFSTVRSRLTPVV